MQAEIAQSVIEQIGSQVDLLITLALATTGALAALILQVILHNHSRDPAQQPIRFRGDRLLLGCLVLEGVSIFFGYCSRAAITSLTPAIFHLDYSRISNFTEADFEGGSTLRNYAGAQFILFILGVLLVVCFVALNLNLVRRSQ